MSMKISNYVDLYKIIEDNILNKELVQELYALREIQQQLDTVINYHLVKIVKNYYKTKYKICISKLFFNL